MKKNMLIPFKLHICYFGVLRISVMDRNNIKDGWKTVSSFCKAICGTSLSSAFPEDLKKTAYFMTSGKLGF